MIYRAAYFDLDGTLIRRDGSIDPRVTAKIRELSEAGVHTAIASGRPSFAAFDIASSMSMQSPSMFFSGSLIMEPESREVILAKALSKELLRETIEFCEENAAHLELYTVENYFVNTKGPLLDIHHEYLKMWPGSCGKLALLEVAESQPILKLVIMLTAEKLADFQSLASTLLSNFAIGMSYGASHPDIVFLNLTSPEATREAAFAELIHLHAVKAEEVVCFGDAEADVPFMKLAGLGVAMANAPEGVRQAADRIAADVDQDGVLSILEEIQFFRA